jgi:protein phosphatase
MTKEVYVNQKQTVQNQGEILFADGQHIGYGQQRSSLEDRCFSRQIITAGGLELTVALVADGIGGASAGETASQLVVDTVLEVLQNAQDNDIFAMIQRALVKAHQEVRKTARLNVNMRSMGTTATLGVIYDHHLYLGHIGDSRAYLVRQGKITQLTLDHTWGNENVRKGKLRPEEAERHPRRDELARFIGQPDTTPLEIDLGVRDGNLGEPGGGELHLQGLPLQAGDVVVLCTDGLIKERRNGGGHFVEEREIVNTVARNSPMDAVNTLISLALGRQVDDNVSVAILEMKGKRKSIDPALIRLVSLSAVAAVLVGLVIFVIFFVKPPLPPPMVTVGPTFSASEGVAILDQSEDGLFVSVGEGGAEKKISAGEYIPAGDVVLVRTQLGNAQLRLQDGTLLYLAPDTQLDIKAPSNPGGQAEVTLIKGKLLAVANDFQLEFKDRNGEFAGVHQNGILGVEYDPSQVNYHYTIACLGLRGAACFLQGPSGLMQVAEGEELGMEKGSFWDKPRPLNWLFWQALAPDVVIVPTAVPTYTPTASSTPPPIVTQAAGSTQQPGNDKGGETTGNGSGGGENPGH